MKNIASDLRTRLCDVIIYQISIDHYKILVYVLPEYVSWHVDKQLSRGEICVANIIHPAHGASLCSYLVKK